MGSLVVKQISPTQPKVIRLGVFRVNKNEEETLIYFEDLPVFDDLGHKLPHYGQHIAETHRRLEMEWNHRCEKCHGSH